MQEPIDWESIGFPMLSIFCANARKHQRSKKIIEWWHPDRVRIVAAIDNNIDDIDF